MNINSLVLMIGWLVLVAVLHVFAEWLIPGFGFMILGLWFVTLLLPFRLSSRSMVQSTPRQLKQNLFMISIYILLFPMLALLIIGMTQIICSYQLYFDFSSEVWTLTCKTDNFRNISESLSVPYLISCGILLIGLLAPISSNALQSAQRWERFYGRFDSLALHLGYGIIFFSILPISIRWSPDYFLPIGCTSMLFACLFASNSLTTQWYTLFVQIILNFLTSVIIIPSLWYGQWWLMTLISTPSTALQDLFDTYPILEVSALIGATAIFPIVVMTVVGLPKTRYLNINC